MVRVVAKVVEGKYNSLLQMDILVCKFFPELMKIFDANDEVPCVRHG